MLPVCQPRAQEQLCPTADSKCACTLGSLVSPLIQAATSLLLPRLLPATSRPILGLPSPGTNILVAPGVFPLLAEGWRAASLGNGHCWLSRTREAGDLSLHGPARACDVC